MDDDDGQASRSCCVGCCCAAKAERLLSVARFRYLMDHSQASKAVDYTNNFFFFMPHGPGPFCHSATHTCAVQSSSLRDFDDPIDSTGSSLWGETKQASSSRTHTTSDDRPE